ncbi:hypothetical protein BH11PLA1_BH11PLA1_10060 [soil metagenome]
MHESLSLAASLARPRRSASHLFALALALAGLLAAGAGGLGGCQKMSDTKIEDGAMTMADVRAVLADQAKNPDKNVVVLLDARRGSQFADGSLPRAQMVDLAQISLNTRRVDPRIEKFDTKVVYGNNPADGIAKAVAKKMIEGGYSDVRWFRGGYEEWTRGAGETTKPQKPGATAQ